MTDDELTATPVRPRSLLQLGVLALAIPTVVAVAAALGAERLLRDRIADSHQRFARALADQVALEFGLAVDGATAAARRASARAGLVRGDAVLARAALANTYETTPFFDGLVLVDAKGGILAQEPDHAAAELAPWLTGPMPGARELRLLEHAGDLIVRVPVTSESGVRLGTLVAGVSLAKILKTVEGVSFGATGHATLVHRDGQVLASSDPARQSRRLRAPEVLALLDLGRDGVLEYRSPTLERDEFSATAAVRDWPLALLISQSRAETYAPVRIAQAGVAIAVLLLLGAGAGLAWFARRAFLGYEAALHRSRERIARYAKETKDTLGLRDAILTNANNSIITVDRDGVIRSANATALRWFGYQEHEMVGRMTAFDLLPPDLYQAIRRETAAARGVPIDALHYEDFVERARRGEMQQVERTFLRKDGGTFNVVISVSALRDIDGNVTGYLGVSTDITALKAAEQAVRESELRFRVLFENAPIGVFQTDPQGVLVLTNPWYTAATGRDFHQLRADWAGAVHPDDRGRVQAAWDRAFAERGRLDIEFRYRRTDGQVTWAHALAIPLHDEEGRFTGYMGTTLDVSARKRVEQLKNEFIATVSHELRTPLTSIRGSLGLLTAGVAGALPEQADHLVRIAHSNSERLVRLINDILDIERIEAGKMDFRLEPLDLTSVVENAVLANRGYADQYGVSFAFRDRPRRVRVQGDRDRLMQVLANLMSNAAKFAPRDSLVELTVQADAQRARVAVTDGGAGIPTEFRARIFNKFAQADSSDTREKGGSGLGLSITKAIVERLGGSIGFDSAPGRTTFWFELPLIDAETPPDARRQAT